MKLRQKLAVVLASAMVVTAVPVVTMAASTNNLTKDAVVVTKDTTLSDATTAPALKLSLKDYSGQKEVFYLKLDNATWNKEAMGALSTTGFSISDITSTELKVTVEADASFNPTTDKKVVQIPLLATIEEGEATVEVVKMGSNTTVSTGKYVFAITSDAAVAVTVGSDIPTLYTGGKIADIMLTESMAGAFAQAVKDGKGEVEITLENADYEFVNAGEVKLAYGFAGQGNDETAVRATVNKNDKQVITVQLPDNFKADSMGQIRLTGIEVKATTKTPATGDLTISVDGKATEAQRELKVAKITEYGNEITVADKDKVEITAGRQKEVKFTLAETEKGSFVNGRKVEFTFDKGYLMNEVEENEVAELEKVVTLKGATITDVIVKDKKVVGFEAEVQATENLDKIEVAAKITAGLQEEGDVTVTVSGRALEKEVSAVITKINPAVSVNTEAAVLKVGLQGQKSGKVVVTEADKAMFKTGSTIEFTIPVANGITVKEAPEVKVTAGDIQMGTPKVTTSKDGKTATVTVPVKRASKTASTIEIANFGFTTDRTVAEGSFDVTLSGSALSETETIELKDFLVIGTPNTEDLGSNGLVKGTSTFVIGENKYTVNGVEKEMDARSYVQDPGYTMVPMRYVAEAFGVTGNNVLFSKGVTTIFAGNRTIQLTNNSDVAVVNGVQIKMATKVVIKDGRTYAPIGEVAQLLGVSKAWDNATKTATFTNK